MPEPIEAESIRGLFTLIRATERARPGQQVRVAAAVFVGDPDPDDPHCSLVCLREAAEVSDRDDLTWLREALAVAQQRAAILSAQADLRA